MYFKGHRYHVLNHDVFVSLKHILILANSADYDEIMLHFIWVFTVCQSTGLGVSSMQRVKMSLNTCTVKL